MSDASVPFRVPVVASSMGNTVANQQGSMQSISDFRWRWIAFTIIALVAALSTAAAAETAPYRLGVSDKVNVRVVEWQPSGSTFVDWTAVAGDYQVGAEGMISFPFVGEIPAAGKSTAELAKALSEGLRSTLGLTDPPDVTVEVESFGPVYVTGDVRSSGAYPFAPGLNVIKAISLAGGLSRSATADGAVPDADRRLIDLQGNYDVLLDQRTRLIVHRARLDAMIANQTTLTLPAEINGDDSTTALVAEETLMLKTTQDQIKVQLSSYDAQKQLLTKSIDSLAQKRDAASVQLTLARDQLQKVQSLASDGLAVATRVMDEQSNVADLEGRLLDIESADLQARQDVSAAEDQSAKVLSDTMLQAAQDRQDTNAQIAQLDLKIATQQRLIQQALDDGAMPIDPGTAIYSYSILRDGTEIEASKVDALQPGDVVTATLSMTP